MGAGAGETAPPDDEPGTVAFVGPESYEVPGDALRRIVRLVIEQTRSSPEEEAI
jgi:hypothetical protein